jgi:hypothetical protein
MPKPIESPEFFSLHENYAECRPVGELSLEEAVKLIDDSLRYCLENDVTRLLADISATMGLPSPSLTDRFWLITKWAESAQGFVTLAVVAPRDIIHPEKLGEVFAANRGLDGGIFADKNEAINWLRSR